MFVERLWRSVKYEEVYLRAYDSVPEARTSIGQYLDFYKRASQHPSVYVRRRKGSRDAFLYAFDLLELDGHDLRRDPWETRRDALASLLCNSALETDVGHGILFSEHLDGADGEIVFRHACRMGLEGIVAKRRDRPYQSGRSPDWVKVTNPNAPAVTRTSKW